MSMKTHVSIVCDKEGCNAAREGRAGETARSIRASAKEYQWKLGKQKDFCPSCSAEIAKAVASAKAGNV